MAVGREVRQTASVGKGFLGVVVPFPEDAQEVEAVKPGDGALDDPGEGAQGRCRVICPDRSFCNSYGRGQNGHRMIPGRPYSVVAALEAGRTSWTAVLDAIRLEPGADVAVVTTARIREGSLGG